MKIREKTIIQRPPVDVWPWIAVPERFQQWNDKIISMEARERFVLHHTFSSQYRLRGKPLQCRSTVQAIEENRHLELRHHQCIGPGSGNDMEVVERIDLQDKGDHTVVIKTITVKNHHIPLLLLPLIWFVTRFGKPVEPDRLKQLCEGKEIPAATAVTLPGLHGDKRQQTAGARPGYVTQAKAQPFSLTGMFLPLLIVASFGWMLANVITPISAAIVLFNSNGYRHAVFTVENLYHEDRRRTGLQWGFTGTVAGTRERFFAPELAREESTSFLALEKRFPKGSKLDVMYNPDVARDLFQARTIRILPYNPDFAKQEERRIYWWLKYCLLPFLAVTVIASKLRGKQKGQPPT